MYNPYDPTEKGADYYHDPIPSPPPPPDWKPKRHRRPWFVFALIAIIVAATSFVATMSTSYWIHHQEPPTATPQPVMSPHYTVVDITTEMKKDGCPCGHRVSCPDGGINGNAITCSSTDALLYGTTILQWLGPDYPVDIETGDSTTWPDPYGATQAPDNVGLWIYNTATDARAAYTEVENDNMSPNSSTPKYMEPTEFIHGRCLLLMTGYESLPTNPDARPWAGYQKALNKYCV